MRPASICIAWFGAVACATGPEVSSDAPATIMAPRLGDCPVQSEPKARPAFGRTGAPATFAGAVAAGPLAVTHGGVGSPAELADGPDAAAARALRVLGDHGSALDAAIEGTIALEDDPRFNAGTGSNIRLDGKTIQMDAALMAGDGAFAAVAVIERVKNPIRAARLVLDSPHVLLAGEGATRFAHRMGLPDEVPVSKEAERRYRERLQRLRSLVESGDPDRVDWAALWNFPGEIPEDMRPWFVGGDTVGTVTRDEDGEFAATLSTGGTSVTLYGRVGDVPVYGAGLYAGELGAVACTGEGEEIIRQGLARKVYERIESGVPAKEAVREAVLDFPESKDVGIIAVDRFGFGVGANRSMAFGAATAEDAEN